MSDRDRDVCRHCGCEFYDRRGMGLCDGCIREQYGGDESKPKETLKPTTPVAKTSGTNATMLDAIPKINSELGAAGIIHPANWDTLNDSQKTQWYQKQKESLSKTHDLVNVLDKNIENEEQTVKDMSQTGIEPTDTPIMQQTAKKIVFNLKKISQIDAPPAPLDASSPGLEQNPNGQDLSTVDGLKQALDGIKAQSQQGGEDPESAAINMLDKLLPESDDQSNNQSNDLTILDENNHPSDPRELIRDAIRDYFSTDDDTIKTEAVLKIVKILPKSVKGEPDSNIPPLDTGIVPNLASIQTSNEAIKKLAENTAKKAKSSSFNLKRYAQRIGDAIIYGPSEKTVDQFNYLHEPISDWHLVERNKGYGLRLPGVNNIDWEKTWREHIMDSYKWPSRDKDGNWGGGYIDERFEVDRNIPPQNNLQLKPGQLRRPVLPEYGNTESRLEASRIKLNEERGYKPSEKGEPFNWKKAQSHKKKITAFIDDTKDYKDYKLHGEKQLNTKQSVYCTSCGAQLSSDQQKCDKCGGAPITGDPKTAPDASGPKQVIDPAIQPGQQLNSTIYQNTAPQLKNAIFFDSDEQKFIVYAGTDQKMKFGSFDDAEKYAESVAPAVPATTVPPAAHASGEAIMPQQIKSRLKRKPVLNADNEGVVKDPRSSVTANELAIDG